VTAAFSEATWQFLDRLAADNTRATFEAQRGTYDGAVVAPSVALVESLTALLPAEVHPGLQTDPAVGRSRFRLNRDLRFSKDKTPYKTHLDFLFWIGEGPPRAQPACILRLTSTEVLLGAGQMGLSREALARYRERLDDAGGGATVRAVVAALEADGATLSDADRLRVPKPYPADHPSADLLRRDGFHLTSSEPHPAALDSGDVGDFAAWCAERWSAFRPLLDWFVSGAPPT
jgi:uncharacterized protein (TIGR02453 family)